MVKHIKVVMVKHIELMVIKHIELIIVQLVIKLLVIKLYCVQQLGIFILVDNQHIVQLFIKEHNRP